MKPYTVIVMYPAYLWPRPGEHRDGREIDDAAGHHDDINPAMRRGRSERRNG